jgi:aminoglycoside phosphotransferase (APT) family kinase protein
MSGMEERIATYLAHQMPDARDVTVDQLTRIPGGSSQETFKLRARWDGEARWLIVRRAPSDGLVVAERDVEFLVYRALAGGRVPVPRVHFMEMDPQWLDRPFFIMDMMPGKPGHFFHPGDVYEGRSAEVGEHFWRHLGSLAAHDAAADGLGSLRNAGRDGGEFWQAELGHWERIILANERLIEPAEHGAIRWLRANPPPAPAKPAVVHGDYRSGNFLFTPDGEISAILDWEMTHIGDPLEDIAWALNPMWTMERHFPIEEGLKHWEAASGLIADRKALDWWRLFSTVKACAIWTTAQAAFAAGNRDMAAAMSAVRGIHFHRSELLERMAIQGAMG